MRLKGLLLAAFVLLVVGRLHAECRVEGVVRGADGTPLAGAVVQLDGGEYRQPIATTADMDGRYAFADVQPGVRVRLVAVQAGRIVARSYTLVTLPIERVDLHVPAARTDAVDPNDLYADLGEGAEVAGIVTGKGRPLLAARLQIAETETTASTDDAGRYAFVGLRPGLRLRVVAAADGFESKSVEVVVPNRGRVSGDIALDVPGEALGRVSEAALPSILTSPDGAQVLVHPDATMALPSLARGDVFRALELLPGVVADREGSGDLSVRGGMPGDSRVSLDGVTLYQANDDFGPFGGVNPAAVGRASYTRMPAHAADAAHLSSPVELTGPSGVKGRAAGSFDFDLRGLGAAVGVPVGNRASLYLATRGSLGTSLYDRALDVFGSNTGTAVRDRVPRFSGGALPALSSASTFRDLNGGVDVRPGNRDRLRLSFYDGRSDLNGSHDFSLPAPATNTGVTEPTLRPLPDDTVQEASDVRHATARGVSGSWDHEWTLNVSTSVSVSHSQYAKASDRSWLLASPSTALDYSFIEGHGGSGAQADSNQVLETTVRAGSTIALGFAHSLSVGGEVSTFTIDYTAQSEVFNTLPGNGLTSRLLTLLSQSGTGRVSAVYAQDAWRPFARLTVSPGVRLGRFDLAGATLFDPRVNASYQVTPLFQVKGGWSVDHQVANRIAREDRLHGNTTFWGLADGSAIPIPRVRQAVAGGTLTLPGVLLEVDGFYKSFGDISLFAPRLVPGTLVGLGPAMLYEGTARARGLEWLLQHKNDVNAFWLSYTVGETLYTFSGLEANPFPAPSDVTQELKLTDTVRLGTKWTVTGAFVATSGRPYTPAQGVETVWLPTGLPLSQVRFAATNSARLPEYHRLDVSTERVVVVRSRPLSVGATLFNVYNQQNVANFDNEARAGTLVTNRSFLMGRALNGYVRVSF